MVFDEDGKLLRVVRLTRKEYYQLSGINHAQEHYNKWNLRIKHILEEMSLFHLKTSRINRFLEGVSVIVRHYDELWTHKFLNCYQSKAFFVEGKKAATLHSKIHEIGDVDVIGYGSGTFASGGKGKKYVPVKGVKDLCSKVYGERVQECDEWNSSSVCVRCEGQLFPMFQVYDGDKYDIRGEKW